MREVYVEGPLTMGRTRVFEIYSRILARIAPAYYLYAYQHGKSRETRERQGKTEIKT